MGILKTFFGVAVFVFTGSLAHGAKSTCVSLDKEALKPNVPKPGFNRLTVDIENEGIEGEQIWIRSFGPYREQDRLVPHGKSTISVLLFPEQKQLHISLDPALGKKKSVKACNAVITPLPPPPEGILFWDFLPDGKDEIPGAISIKETSGFSQIYPDPMTASGIFFRQEHDLPVPQPFQGKIGTLVINNYNPGFWEQVPHIQKVKWKVSRAQDKVLISEKEVSEDHFQFQRKLFRLPPQKATRADLVHPVETQAIFSGLTLPRGAIQLECNTSNPRECGAGWAAFASPERLPELYQWLEKFYPIDTTLNRTSVGDGWVRDAQDYRQIRKSHFEPLPESLELLPEEPFFWCASSSLKLTDIPARSLFLRKRVARFNWGRTTNASLLWEITNEASQVELSCLYGHAPQALPIKTFLTIANKKIPLTIKGPRLPNVNNVGVFVYEPAFTYYYAELEKQKDLVMTNLFKAIKDLGVQIIALGTGSPKTTTDLTFLKQFEKPLRLSAFSPKIILYDAIKQWPESKELSATLKKVDEIFPAVRWNIADEQSPSDPELLKGAANTAGLPRVGFINREDTLKWALKEKITAFCPEHLKCTHRYNLNNPRLSVPYTEYEELVLWHGYNPQGWSWDDFDSRERDYGFVQMIAPFGEFIPTLEGINLTQAIFDKRILEHLDRKRCARPNPKWTIDLVTSLTMEVPTPKREELRKLVEKCP